MKRPILFLLNNRNVVSCSSTHATLIAACMRRGNDVFVTDVLSLHARSTSEIFALATQFPPRFVERNSSKHHDLSKLQVQRIDLATLDGIFVRTTPGKDIARAWAHRLSLEVMRLAADLGVRVLNDPAGLQKASSKLYTVCLPSEFVPKTLVCHSAESARSFADSLGGPFVIKPLLGSQGRDVFFFDRLNSLNISQVCDIVGRSGYLIVQEYLPEADEGDIRVITLDDGLTGNQPIGIRRTPAQGEMRSNVALGGTATVVQLTDEQASVCHRIAGQLASDGIRYAGLDLIGTKVVEVNVFSPSGIQELDRHAEGHFSANLVDHLLGKPDDKRKVENA